jgi:hypothetical protein
MALLISLANDFVDFFGRYRWSTNQHWESVAYFEARLGEVLFKHEPIAGALNAQPRALFKPQGIAHLFGDDDAAGFVDFDNGIHNAILPLKMVFLPSRQSNRWEQRFG